MRPILFREHRQPVSNAWDTGRHFLSVRLEKGKGKGKGEVMAITILGWLMIAVFMFCVMTKKLSPLVALCTVPMVFAFLVLIVTGNIDKWTLIGDWVMNGIGTTANTGVLLLFAILYFSIMLDTGFRPCEVAGLERSLIDENGAVYTAQEVDTPTRTLKKRIKTTGRGKGKKYGLLSRYTMDLLEEYLEDHDGEYLFIEYDGRFISGNKVNDVLRRACWVVGIDIRERTSYCWRHTFDTHMMQSLGGNIKESDIHDLMGHTGYRPEYDHRTPQQIMFKMQKIRPAIEALRAGKDQNIV